MVVLAPSAELESGQRTGHFRLGGDQLLADENGRSHVSVQDYAVATINELETPVACPSALHCRVLIAQTEGQRDADLNAAKALIAACLSCFSCGRTRGRSDRSATVGRSEPRNASGQERQTVIL